MSETTPLIPERVRGVDLYDPHREPIKYDLSDNTSQWFMAPAVRDAIACAAGNPALTRYPDIYGRSLKQALVSYFAHDRIVVLENQFVIGCGTDDILDCIIRALSNEGDAIAVGVPTFPMASYFGEYNGRTTVTFPLEKDGSFDTTNVADLTATIMYLCSPNNPTGQLIGRNLVEELAEKFTGFIVIDEAYAEFSDQNFADLVERFPRVIVMRTFSKIHALAGLRIGYSLSSEEIAQAIEAVRGPYKANVIALEAAKESLTQREFHENVKNEMTAQRTRLFDELVTFGLNPVVSDSNFVLVPMTIPPTLAATMKEAGIAVRIYDNVESYGPCIRVTVAPREPMDAFIAALRKVL